jgi:hypothetical protein
MPEPSDRSVSPCPPRAARSVRSAAVAVCVTGILTVAVPLGLLLGKNGIVTASVNRQTPIPAPHVTDCQTNQAVRRLIVARGQCVRVRAAGFQPGELVQVGDSRRTGWQRFIRADPAGSVDLRFEVGTTAGPEVLTFLGLNVRGSATAPRVTFCRLAVAET